MMKKFLLIGAAVTLLISLHFLAFAEEPVHLKLATTTSTVDTGLFDYMLPKFEQKFNIKVDVISVGTGKAFKLGENGDVDVILVHDRPAEDDFVAKGFGVNRKDVMHNQFLIVGPADDPAKIKKAASAVEAFARLGQAKAPFVSRGDDSGTHRREMQLWQKANVKAEGVWYMSAGQGMGQVLRMADEKKAYTLSDEATYLALSPTLSLKVIYSGDKMLFNPYGVIIINPQRYKNLKYYEAMKFADWLTSKEGQDMIRGFKKDGHALFVPDAVP